MASWMLGLFGTMALGTGIGCQSFHPVPGRGRDGGLYRYTVDYNEKELPFALAGKALCVEGSKKLCSPLLLPALFVGVPLYTVERFAICPVVDTALLPYDIALKWRKSHICKYDGVRVRLTDGTGMPVPGCEIGVIVDERPGWRIVYAGKPCPRRWYGNHVTTDEAGEAYIPVDLSTCRGMRIEGWAPTTRGKEEFRAAANRDYSDWWVQVPRVHRGSEPGEEYHSFVIRLQGRLLPEKAEKRWPPGTVFALGTAPGDPMPNGVRSIGQELATQWAELSVPEIVGDFDAWWDEAAAKMRKGWRGEVEVEAIPSESTAKVHFSRIEFEAGGRRMAGWLSEPVAGTPGTVPTLAFFGRGPDPAPESLPKPTDRTVLYLSVFEPGYDYRLKERELQTKYRWENCEAYAIAGMDEGREASFFYPVLSGALRAAEWLAQRSGAEGVRCAGTDQGAALALMTAALSPQVAEADVHNPAFVDVMKERIPTYPPFHWHRRNGRMEEARRWMPYYELCGFASRIRCPVTLRLNPREHAKTSYGLPSVSASLVVMASLPPENGNRLVLDSSLTESEAFGRVVEGR